MLAKTNGAGGTFDLGQIPTTELPDGPSEGATDLHVTVAGMSEGALSVLDTVAETMTGVRTTLTQRGKLLADAIEEHGGLCEQTADAAKVMVDALQKLQGLFKSAMRATPANEAPKH